MEKIEKGIPGPRRACEKLGRQGKAEWAPEEEAACWGRENQGCHQGWQTGDDGDGSGEGWGQGVIRRVLKKRDWYFWKPRYGTPNMSVITGT